MKKLFRWGCFGIIGLMILSAAISLILPPEEREEKVNPSVPTWTPTLEQQAEPIKATPTGTLISTPTPELPTPTPVPTAQPTAPPATVEPAATLPPTSIPAAATGAVANADANLRAGPGTDHPVVGSVTPGQGLTIIGRNAAGDWYQLDSGSWVFGQLVDNAPDVPVVEVQPIAVCGCDGNTKNCGDFRTRAEAQACYNYCLSVVGYDVHELDGSDKDGDVCETLP